jgi:ABC-type polysaccharide/polyol phosphate export permease
MGEWPLLEIWRRRRLVWQLSLRDVRGKYAGSLMGVFWTVINPLLLLAVFTFIFAVVFKARFGGRAGLAPSALYILCGILPWLAFQDGLARAGTVVMENKNLVTRARFPLAALAAYPALSALSGQLIGAAALLLVAAFSLGPPGPSLLAFPLLLALQFALTLGLALALAAAAVYLRDLVHVLPVTLLCWMYATPIFYPEELVPERFHLVIVFNPLATLVTAYRRVLLEAAWPETSALLTLAGFAAASLLIGSLVFARLSPGFADRL